MNTIYIYIVIYFIRINICLKFANFYIFPFKCVFYQFVLRIFKCKKCYLYLPILRCIKINCPNIRQFRVPYKYLHKLCRVQNGNLISAIWSLNPRLKSEINFLTPCHKIRLVFSGHRFKDYLCFPRD